MSKRHPTAIFSPEQRKKFRSDIAKLRRKGLLPKHRAGKIVPLKSLQKALEQFQSVTEGNARVFKVSPRQAASYKEHGYNVANNRIVLPADQRVITRGKRKGAITSTRQSGRGPKITTVRFPYRLRTLDNDLARIKQGIDAGDIKIDENERWGFEFYGWNSSRLFDDIGDMIDLLQSYETFERGSPDQIADRIRNVVIMRVDPYTPPGNSWYAANADYVKSERRKAARVRKKRKSDKPFNAYSAASKKEYDREYRKLHYSIEKADKLERQRKRRKAKK